nr:uncharacterized protein LOC113803415 [Penaeus vannamei]
MNSALILLVAVGLSCLMAVQATSFGVLAGLGALTSAISKRRYHGASHGRGHGHGYRAPKRKYRLRYRRSVAAADEEDDDLILSAVGQLDADTCIPKMFCVLQAKDESDRTQKENMLVEILSDNTMNPNSTTLPSSTLESSPLRRKTPPSARRFSPNVHLVQRTRILTGPPQ